MAVIAQQADAGVHIYTRSCCWSLRLHKKVALEFTFKQEGGAGVRVQCFHEGCCRWFREVGWSSARLCIIFLAWNNGMALGCGACWFFTTLCPARAGVCANINWPGNKPSGLSQQPGGVVRACLCASVLVCLYVCGGCLP